MYNTNTSRILRTLTGGQNPDTSAILPGAVSAYSNTYQNYLILLVHELASHAADDTPWAREEVDQLTTEWQRGKLDVESIAINHRRTGRTIALKVISAGIDNEYAVLHRLAINDLCLAQKRYALNIAQGKNVILMLKR